MPFGGSGTEMSLQRTREERDRKMNKGMAATQSADFQRRREWEGREGGGGCRRDKIEQKGVDEVDERGIEQANENHKHTQKCGNRNHVCHNINICIYHFSLIKGIEKKNNFGFNYTANQRNCSKSAL